MRETNAVQNRMKEAMSRLAGGVSIVTAAVNNSRMAMVATSVSSLCLDPPALLICVNRNASIFAALTTHAQFCVNILSGHHEQLAQRCAAAPSGADRFAEGNWLAHVNGVPYLADAQASIFCMVDGALDYGSHGIFVGRVSDLHVDRRASSLVYFDRRYVRL